MDSEAVPSTSFSSSISEALPSPTIKKEIKKQATIDEEKLNIFSNKEFEGQKITDEKEEVIIKKKVSTSLSAKSIDNKIANSTEHQRNNEYDTTDIEKPTTSSKISENIESIKSTAAPKIIPMTTKLSSKKLSIDETTTNQRFNESSSPKLSKRRRSSIPKFAHEEIAGTDPSLFVCHKAGAAAAFKYGDDDQEDEEEILLTSDPMESEMETTDPESSPDMVVSESIIMFILSESSAISEINPQIELIDNPEPPTFSLLSEPEELIDDDTFEESSNFFETSEPSKNAIDIIVEVVDTKTGSTLDLPRTSDSSDDKYLPKMNIQENGEITIEVPSISVVEKNIESPKIYNPLHLENKKLEDAPSKKISLSGETQPETVNNEEAVKKTIFVEEKEKQKIIANEELNLLDNVGEEQKVAEKLLEKPPKPPSPPKKMSTSLDEQHPSTSAASIGPEILSLTPEPPSIISQTSSSEITTSNNTSELISPISTDIPSSPISSSKSPESVAAAAIIRSQSPPIKKAPPIPPPPKFASTSKATTLTTKQDLSPKISPDSSSNVITDTCLPRILQTLTIWPQQFRPLTGLLVSNESRVSIQIKLDDEEILQTIAVGGNQTRIFSEKALIDIKRPYQFVKLIFIEHTENSETRQIGKLHIRKKDILPINGRDVMLPVQGSPSSRSTVSSILGEICLNIEPKGKDANIISLSVLDYTALIPTPPRRLSTSSTSSNSSLSSPPLFFRNRVHLAFCITAYGELLGTMKKITLFDRRSIDKVEFNLKTYSEKFSNIRARHASNDSSANGSTNYSNNGSNGNGNGKESEASHVRLNIKIYSEPTYDDSSYVGFVRIPLDSETFMPLEKCVGANWYEIKSRMTISQNTTILQQPSTSTTSSTNNLSTSQYDALDNMLPSTSTSITTTTTTTTTTTNTTNIQNNNNSTEKVGDLRIRFWYSVEHILALNHYQPLYEALMSSLDSKPYEISLTSILQHLPVDLGQIARPLMKIFLKHDLFNDFFRLVATQYVSTSNETSTLFRNQSMASKLMHEMMKFVGQEYLISTLKPVIDLVYAEKKRCEIDPTKLRQGENLEENTRNFAVYAELAFVRVCESSNQCPQIVKNVLNVLREVVFEKYPNRVEISRLAVSSFTIMRFFAAAILSPTQYGLKRKAPEPDVSRTLVLISKILQRLANCVVTQQPLITKEPWLSSVLERFFDDGHRHEMVEFFDSISIKNYQPHKSSSSSSKNLPHKPEILKSGLMVEKRGGSNRRRSIKDLISQKRRLVTLTPKELSWQKEKKDSQGEVEQKGVIPLSEITSVTQINDAKSSFRVATPHQEVHFQAVNNIDMTDWMILLITHQRRHLFFHNRVSNKTKNPHNIDMEKELETLHSLLFENIETIIGWKETLETFNIESEISSCDKFPQIMFQKVKSIEERKKLRESLLKTITNVLSAVQSIESVHQTALTLAIQMQNLQSIKSDKLGGMNNLSDNENYLLMRGRDRHLKTKGLQAVSPT